MAALGDRIADRYRLEARLGAGAGGIVFAAVDERSGDRVAVKILAAAGSPVLDLERTGLHAVRHPHLVAVLDAGTGPSGAYLVTELVPGGGLAAIPKPLDPESLHAATTQLLEALAFLHAQGILHGDVKTDNVLVQSLAPPHFKLGDFGMARLHSHRDGVTRGSPAYMPPEIIRGEPADERSDLYALGCTLYECAFGELPFTDDDVRRILLRHLNDMPPHLDRDSGLEVRFLRLLRSLLAKEPAARPMDARAALAAWRGEDAAVPRWVPPRLGVLIGREAELAALESALADSRTAIVTCEGPAGIGKTRLLREFALRGELAGLHVIEMTGRDLAGVAPEIRTDDARALAVARAAEVHRRLGTGPWILIIDEVDDLPSSMRDALAFLIRDLASDAASGQLAVLAGRGEAALLAQDALRSGGLPAAPAIRLEPWNALHVDAAASALFGARRLRPELVDLLHTASGGMPAEVEALAQRLVHEQLLRTESDGTLTVSRVLQPAEVVESRSDRMALAYEARTAAQQRLLSTLVLSRVARSANFIDHVHPRCEADLDVLQRSGLVVAVRGETSLRFAPAHEGVRQFVHDRLSPRDRAAMHDHIAAALRSLGTDPSDEDVAWHEIHGSNFTRARAALEKFLARPQSINQPELMRDAYSTVLEHWPADWDQEDRFRVGIALVRVLFRLGDHRAMNARIDTLLPQADAATAAALREMRARMYMRLGQTQQCLEALEDTVSKTTEATNTPVQLSLLISRGEALGSMMRFKDALDALETVWRHAEPGSPAFDQLLDPLVFNLTEVGRLPEAERLLATASEHYASNKNLAGLAVATNRLGLVAFKRGDMRVAFEHLAHAHDLFHECRDPFGMMIALNGLGAAACELGRFTEARNYFRAAIDLCQRYGEARNLSTQLGNLALTLGTIGEYVEALAQSQRAQDVAVEGQLENALVSILIARGGLLATLGLEAEARAALDSLKLDSLREFNLGQRELVLAQLELQAQRPGHADAHLTRAEQFLHTCGAEDELVIHDLLKARCDWMLDRRAEAVVRLRRACDAADSMHLRLTRCQLDATLGELLAEIDAPEASGHAQAGLEAAHGMGVAEIEWRCERALGLIASGHRDWTAAREFYQRCIAILRELTVAMPAEMAGAYLAVPERRRVFHEIRALAVQSSS